MRRVLARRDMRLYVAGQTLSLFGDSALWLALGVWAKVLTGSSAAAGMVMFFIAAPRCCRRCPACWSTASAAAGC